MFSKNIRIIYFYVVAFITLMMIAGGIIATVNSVANYYLPNTNYYYQSPSSLEIEKKVITDNPNLTVAEKQKEIDKITTNEQYNKKIQQEQQIAEKENTRIRNIKSIFSSIAVLVVAIPLFLYHWRKIQKEREV